MEAQCLLAVLVIGRGGEMINKLQTDSAARIQVAPGMYTYNYYTESKNNVECFYYV